MTKRRTLTLLAALFIGMLLAGCSAISAGTITQKNHSEGYYLTTTYCASYDSKGYCSMYLPRQTWYPPSWSFSLKNGEKTGWATVSEDTYGNYEVGDYFGTE